ncbi:MAG TPA: Spy/CpxP family protein refolding chaperone [Candidatus Sulfotelmatobacter sp.]|jgi:hypothetical protein|nr:Spy/CpxP family protein refolding chaperone [Candidatus Sulfotelmatobacter sp.]
MMRLITVAVLAVLPVLSASAALAEDAPQRDFCGEQYAREAGRLSYLEARLNLTDKQHPAWVKWSQWVLQGAQQERDACQASHPKDHAHLNALDKETAMEKHLQLRLQNMQAARPALQDLYNQLSPEQKAILDQGGHEHKGHRRG